MEPIPEDWDRAVAVVAHPDDLEYGMASAVARWTGQGRSVSYLIVTRGEAGIAAMPPGRVGPLREHKVYIEGLGRDFDPDEFLRSMAGYVGLGAGCEYAVAFRRYNPG